MNMKYIIKKSDIFLLLETLQKNLDQINNEFINIKNNIEFINIKNNIFNFNENKSKLAQLNGNLDMLIMNKIDSVIINNISDNENIKMQAKKIKKQIVNKAEELSKNINTLYIQMNKK